MLPLLVDTSALATGQHLALFNLQTGSRAGQPECREGRDLGRGLCACHPLHSGRLRRLPLRNWVHPVESNQAKNSAGLSRTASVLAPFRSSFASGPSLMLPAWTLRRKTSMGWGPRCGVFDVRGLAARPAWRLSDRPCLRPVAHAPGLRSSGRLKGAQRDFFKATRATA